MTSPVYTAPAARVLTDIHIVDPDAPPVPGTSRDAGTDGETLCGLGMDVAEYWLPLALMPGDRVCRACLGEPDQQQEEALW